MGERDRAVGEYAIPPDLSRDIQDSLDLVSEKLEQASRRTGHLHPEVLEAIADALDAAERIRGLLHQASRA